MSNSRLPLRPVHGDVWCAPLVGGRFSVMMVCGHHDPPLVTGYWHDEKIDAPDPDRHGSIPLPQFLSVFRLTEREYDFGKTAAARQADASSPKPDRRMA